LVRALGWWHPQQLAYLNQLAELRTCLGHLSQPVVFVRTDEGLHLAVGGTGVLGPTQNGSGSYPIAAYLPPISLRNLGDQSFCRDHGLRYPYLAGAMANGIGSVEIVEAMSRAGMLGFFGAAGLSIEAIDAAITRLQNDLGDAPYGLNLIHSPNEPGYEAATVDLYLKRGVRLVEASAYLDLTLPVVRYRVFGIHRGADGRIVTPNRIIAKVSRVEVASKFFAPPPERLLGELIESGELSRDQAELAAQVPMAQDITAEADSGGHTDNRPAITLLPTMLALRDQFQKRYAGIIPLRVGAAGGIATPSSAAAAFAMGAAFILTGSINQACIESGSSDLVRQMLAEAGQADVAMAPAADMFEMGVKVQVLKRGTMFPMRAAKLFELYRTYAGLDALPQTEVAALEKNYFRTSVEEVWRQTRDYFQMRDPEQNRKAESDPKYKMALVFRWYLGQSSRWANRGEPARKIDYQIWCGPAMGAFNEWTKGTYLEDFRNRRVVTVAHNLLLGCAVALRQNQLRLQGIELPREAFPSAPAPPDEIEARLKEEG
jgi:PfaD family protein